MFLATRIALRCSRQTTSCVEDMFCNFDWWGPQHQCDGKGPEQFVLQSAYLWYASAPLANTTQQIPNRLRVERLLMRGHRALLKFVTHVFCASVTSSSTINTNVKSPVVGLFYARTVPTTLWWTSSKFPSGAPSATTSEAVSSSYERY